VNISQDPFSDDEVSVLFPQEVSSSEDDFPPQELLEKLHHSLFEIHVVKGALVCPETGRKFPIDDGIPNMLLHEDEI